MLENNCILIWMVFALTHRCHSAQFQGGFMLYMTSELQRNPYVDFKKCILHIFFLFFQSMEILSPYYSCIVASSHKNLYFQI